MATSPKKATHCSELLGTGPTLPELARPLARLGEKLARALATGLAPLMGGEPPVISSLAPEECSAITYAQSIDGLASYSLLGLGARHLPVLMSIEANPILCLLDRAFGGRGMVLNPVPTVLPLSAELLVGRIEDVVATGLSVSMDSGQLLRVLPLQRNSDWTQVFPFDENTSLLRIMLQVDEPGCAPWTIALAMPLLTLASALVPPRRPRRQSLSIQPGPEEEPFASVPLELKAVLIDMTLPFSRISALRPGDVLPVVVARSVPLSVDGRTIATGTVGEVEDQVTIQIQHAF